MKPTTFTSFGFYQNLATRMKASFSDESLRDFINVHSYDEHAFIYSNFPAADAKTGDLVALTDLNFKKRVGIYLGMFSRSFHSVWIDGTIYRLEIFDACAAYRVELLSKIECEELE